MSAVARTGASGGGRNDTRGRQAPNESIANAGDAIALWIETLLDDGGALPP
jgi:hypothetical protein